MATDCPECARLRQLAQFWARYDYRTAREWWDALLRHQMDMHPVGEKQAEVEHE